MPIVIQIDIHLIDIVLYADHLRAAGEPLAPLRNAHRYMPQLRQEDAHPFALHSIPSQQ